MFTNRKLFMTALAFGLISSPVMAETMAQPSEDITAPAYNFSDYDVNNDSMISEKEFAQIVEDELGDLSFDDYDTDSNGALSELEFSELTRAAINRDEENNIYYQ